MKKFGLLLIMLLAIFIVPFSVLAEDNENGGYDNATVVVIKNI